MKILTKFLKNKTVQNSGWLIAGKLGQMLISLVVGLLTARHLGPANFGVTNYGLPFPQFLDRSTP